MITLTYLSEGLRMFKHHLKVTFSGAKKYQGNASQICKQIVNDCWNKENQYFMTSAGHYKEFYARDFGWSTEALLNMNLEENVIKTLDYALSKYKKVGGIKTLITSDGKPVNFPNYYSIDSVAYIFRSLRLANANTLIEKYHDFLQKEIYNFEKQALDEQGYVKSNTHFSSMRDYSIRSSSCYDNICVAMLNNELKKLKIFDNPLNKFDYKNMIKERYWNGDYFKDDLSNGFVSGDANVFPFWFNIYNSKEMLKKAIKTIEKHKLDKPFPLRYSHSKKDKMLWFEKLVVPNWEKDTVWGLMTYPYIQILSRVNKEKARNYLSEMDEIIESNHNFRELYFRNKKPYKSLFYSADESMIWAAMHLHTKEMINK